MIVYLSKNITGHKALELVTYVSKMAKLSNINILPIIISPERVDMKTDLSEQLADDINYLRVFIIQSGLPNIEGNQNVFYIGEAYREKGPFTKYNHYMFTRFGLKSLISTITEAYPHVPSIVIGIDLPSQANNASTILSRLKTPLRRTLVLSDTAHETKTYKHFTHCIPLGSISPTALFLWVAQQLQFDKYRQSPVYSFTCWEGLYQVGTLKSRKLKVQIGSDSEPALVVYKAYCATSIENIIKHGSVDPIIFSDMPAYDKTLSIFIDPDLVDLNMQHFDELLLNLKSEMSRQNKNVLLSIYDPHGYTLVKYRTALKYTDKKKIGDMLNFLNNSRIKCIAYVPMAAATNAGVEIEHVESGPCRIESLGIKDHNLYVDTYVLVECDDIYDVLTQSSFVKLIEAGNDYQSYCHVALKRVASNGSTSIMLTIAGSNNDGCEDSISKTNINDITDLKENIVSRDVITNLQTENTDVRIKDKTDSNDRNGKEQPGRDELVPKKKSDSHYKYCDNSFETHPDFTTGLILACMFDNYEMKRIKVAPYMASFEKIDDSDADDNKELDSDACDDTDGQGATYANDDDNEKCKTVEGNAGTDASINNGILAVEIDNNDHENVVYNVDNDEHDDYSHNDDVNDYFDENNDYDFSDGDSNNTFDFNFDDEFGYVYALEEPSDDNDKLFDTKLLEKLFRKLVEEVDDKTKPFSEEEGKLWVEAVGKVLKGMYHVNKESWNPDKFAKMIDQYLACSDPCHNKSTGVMKHPQYNVQLNNLAHKYINFKKGSETPTFPLALLSVNTTDVETKSPDATQENEQSDSHVQPSASGRSKDQKDNAVKQELATKDLMLSLCPILAHLGRTTDVSVILKSQSDFDVVPYSLYAIGIFNHEQNKPGPPERNSGVPYEALRNVTTELESLVKEIIAEICIGDQELSNDILFTDVNSQLKDHPFNLARHAEANAFLSEPACTAAIKKRWWKGLNYMPRWKIILFILIPCCFNTKCCSQEQNNEDSDETCCPCLPHIYRIPGVKCMVHGLFFFLYLLLFSYMVLTGLGGQIAYVEYVVFGWMVIFIIEEIIQISTLHKWTDSFKEFWNIVDYIIFMLYIVGIILRVGDYFSSYTGLRLAANLFMALDAFVLYIRSLQFFGMQTEIAMYFITIRCMVKDLAKFMIILAIVLLGYGVSLHSILFPYASLGGKLIDSVLHIPYIQIFGELSIENILAAPSDTDPMWNPDSGPRNYIGLVLVGVYLLFTNILLINLLIAKFNSSYEDTQKNARHICAQEMADLLKEFEYKSIIPPPFVILTYIPRYVYLRSRYRDNKGEPRTQGKTRPQDRVKNTTLKHHVKRCILKLSQKKNDLTHEINHINTKLETKPDITSDFEKVTDRLRKLGKTMKEMKQDIGQLASNGANKGTYPVNIQKINVKPINQ